MGLPGEGHPLWIEILPIEEKPVENYLPQHRSPTKIRYNSEVIITSLPNAYCARISSEEEEVMT